MVCHKAMAAAVLGLVGLVVWAPIGGFALEFAYLADKELAAENGPRRGHGFVMLGRVSGWMSLGILVVSAANLLLGRL